MAINSQLVHYIENITYQLYKLTLKTVSYSKGVLRDGQNHRSMSVWRKSSVGLNNTVLEIRTEGFKVLTELLLKMQGYEAVSVGEQCLTLGSIVVP